VSERLEAARLAAQARARSRISLAKGQRKKRRTLPCAGYVFSLPGRMKIGISRQPEIREAEISLAAGEWVGVVQVLWFKDRASALEWETQAHQDLRAAHVLGEWFEATAVGAWLEQQPIGPGALSRGISRPRLRLVASRTRETGPHNHAPEQVA
jgi:hypothetical protein